MKLLKKSLFALAGAFVAMNAVAAFHAYKFTHFDNSLTNHKRNKPDALTIGQKIKALLFGVSNPKPINSKHPNGKYEVLDINGNPKCWLLHSNLSQPKGTVILCHGYTSSKSSMVERAQVFNQLGYNALLLDFMGCGDAPGNETTIGFKEAQQLKTVYDYLQNKGEQNIILMGTSMGAATIMKALNDYPLKIQSVILECPFGSMYQTVANRFDQMNVPSFPMAGMLVFWGGIENGFWAFDHNPESYAKNIHCPTLLFYGLDDKNVSHEEINTIYSNLSAKKWLKTFPNIGHEDYLIKYKSEWIYNVSNFLAYSENKSHEIEKH